MEGDLSTVLTDSNDNLIFPHSLPVNGRYKMELFTPDSPKLVFRPRGLDAKVVVNGGLETRLWFGRDLRDVGGTMNVGKSCVDAYAVIPGMFLKRGDFIFPNGFVGQSDKLFYKFVKHTFVTSCNS